MSLDRIISWKAESTRIAVQREWRQTSCSKRELRQRGQQRGVRLVFFDSLIDYLKSCETEWTKTRADVVEEEAD